MVKINDCINDERIEVQTRKAGYIAFNVMFIMLLISIAIKSLILDMKFIYFASELLILLVGGFIMGISSMINGNINMGFKGKDSSKNMARIFVRALLGGIIFGVVIGIINYSKYKFDPKMLPMIIIPIFIQFTVFMFIFFWLLDHVSYKMAKKKMDEFDKE